MIITLEEIGVTVMLAVIVILLILGVIAVTYIITRRHDLAKRSMAAVSYILYFIVSLMIGNVINGMTIPPIADYPTTSDVVKLSLWSLIVFLILGLIFGFAFHKFWQNKGHNINYSKRFIKGLNLANVIDIIIIALSVVYTISRHDVITIDVIALLAVVIAVILGFIDFFMMLKTLKLRWYAYGLTLQGFFIILIMIGFSESCM